MGKSLYKCDICHKINRINICRICNHCFCDTCLDNKHHNVIYQNEFEPTDNRVNYVDYCAFGCIGTKSVTSCFDCGEKYINMSKCLCCKMVFCSLCNKNNLYNAKKIDREYYNTGKLFCSKSCYEIYMEDPNNKWLICEDCGIEYYDLTYKILCELCLNKYNYHNNIIFEEKRRELVNKFKNNIETYKIDIVEIESYFLNKVKTESKKWPNITENKVTLDMWLNNENIGNNLCYNIWDDVIETYLNPFV